MCPAGAAPSAAWMTSERPSSSVVLSVGSLKVCCAPPPSDAVETSTFHSVALKIVREHAALLGLTAEFQLFGEGQQYNVVREGLRRYRQEVRPDPIRRHHLPWNVHSLPGMLC